MFQSLRKKENNMLDKSYVPTTAVYPQKLRLLLILHMNKSFSVVL